MRSPRYKCDTPGWAFQLAGWGLHQGDVTMLHRLKCKMCGRDMTAVRIDKLTCSARCRQAYKRQCDQITADMIAAKVLGPGRSAYPRKRGAK